MHHTLVTASADRGQPRANKKHVNLEPKAATATEKPQLYLLRVHQHRLAGVEAGILAFFNVTCGASVGALVSWSPRGRGCGAFSRKRIDSSILMLRKQ
jgi:hypothetical protein